MSKRGISTGGCLFIACTVVWAIWTAIRWFIDGHMPKSLGFGFLGIIVVSIVAEGQEYFEEIRDNTKELKTQNEAILSRLENIEKILDEVQREVQYLDQ